MGGAIEFDECVRVSLGGFDLYGIVEIHNDRQTSHRPIR